MGRGFLSGASLEEEFKALGIFISIIRHSPNLSGEAVQSLVSKNFTGLTSIFGCLYSEVGW